LVLIGFMGTGKSAIGRAIARGLCVRHLDTDCEIERRFQMDIPRIFAEHGEAAFRSAEQDVLRRLARRGPSGAPQPRLIISTGGGTPMREENVDLLREMGQIVWLSAPIGTVLQRVGRNLKQRPLLAGHQDNPQQRIRQLMAEREPRYASLADIRVDTSPFASPKDAAAHIISLLRQNEDL
jgi:shikimate kinase